MKKKCVFLVLAAVLILSLTGWRMWPHTFRAITSSEEETFREISIHLTEMGVSDGRPVIKMYKLVIDAPDDEHYTAVMSILEGTSYRSDFRNVLPWKSSSLGSNSGKITHSATVTLIGENGDICEIFFADNHLVGLLKNRQNGFNRYHPSDRSTLDQIADYTIEHGMLQK